MYVRFCFASSEVAPLTPAAVNFLKQMPALKGLYLFGIGLPDDVLQDIRRQMPNLQILSPPRSQQHSNTTSATSTDAVFEVRTVESFMRTAHAGSRGGVLNAGRSLATSGPQLLRPQPAGGSGSL